MPPALAALRLAGGWFGAQRTGRRELGGALFAAAGARAPGSGQGTGLAAAAGLGAVHVAAMGSHPLAKRVGAWPSVLAVTAVTVAAAEAVTRAGER